MANTSLMIDSQATTGTVYYNKLLGVQINHAITTPVDPDLRPAELRVSNYKITPDRETALELQRYRMSSRSKNGYSEVIFSGPGVASTGGGGETIITIAPLPERLSPLLMRFVVQLQEPFLEVLNTGTNISTQVPLPFIRKKGRITLLRDSGTPVDVENDDSDVLYKQIELEVATIDEDRMIIKSGGAFQLEEAGGFQQYETVQLIEDDGTTVARELVVRRFDTNILKTAFDLTGLVPGPYQIKVVGYPALTMNVYADVYGELSNAGAVIQIKVFDTNTPYNTDYYPLGAVPTLPNWYYLFTYDA